MSEEITTNLENEQEQIGFGPRIGATALDFVINIIVGAIMGAVLGATLVAIFFPDAADPSGTEGFDDAAAAIEGFAAIFAGIIGSMAGVFLMTIIMFLIEGATGQSVGKMILKIKNANVDGSKASAGTLWTRALLKYVYVILALIAGITGIALIGTLGFLLGLVIFIGCFFVLGEKKQSIHDMIAKTAVYRK
ncbi:RDD family protein [Flavobacteriaceae bacterium AU392]|nr:RDD family protein [Flavobacteriaceae bacterium]RKM86475.1 RDD family protein [Flavobacteriaceae bacterium AU392]